MYKGYFSEKANVLLGCIEWINPTGEFVKTTEIVPSGENPLLVFSDLKYVGEVLRPRDGERTYGTQGPPASQFMPASYQNKCRDEGFEMGFREGKREAEAKVHQDTLLTAGLASDNPETSSMAAAGILAALDALDENNAE